MATELLPLGTAAADSSDFTVTPGRTVLLRLKQPDVHPVTPVGAMALVQRQVTPGVYTTVAVLRPAAPAVEIRNLSLVDSEVYRVRRLFCDSPIGVDAFGPEYPIHNLPPVLISGTSKPRIRVDPGQTGFFEKREFRTFKELNIGAGATYVVRSVVPVNVILTGLELDVDDGSLRLETVVGGSPGGTFSETLPIIPRNAMTETPAAYTPQVVLTAGGTHTGGTLLDVIRLHAANATGSAATVGDAQQDERGIAPNTYYFRFTNIGSGSLLGVFRARWEERP